MCRSIDVSHCLEEFSPQTSPSGIIYPMVGVSSMCSPHPFSHFPTSGHPCGPAFLPTWPLHGLRTTLPTLCCTSAPPCPPLALPFPGLVTLFQLSSSPRPPSPSPCQPSPTPTPHTPTPLSS